MICAVIDCLFSLTYSGTRTYQLCHTWHAGMSRHLCPMCRVPGGESPDPGQCRGWARSPRMTVTSLSGAAVASVPSGDVTHSRAVCPRGRRSRGGQDRRRGWPVAGRSLGRDRLSMSSRGLRIITSERAQRASEFILN